jgi:hypothetical protein
MVAVILVDFVNTLLGQPSTFWAHSDRMNEHNQLIRSIAAHGYWYVIVYMLLHIVAAFLFVSLARGRLALAGLLAFILCHYHGGATWIEWHWGFGNTGFIVYGVVLAAVVALVGFPGECKAARDINASTAPRTEPAEVSG